MRRLLPALILIGALLPAMPASGAAEPGGLGVTVEDAGAGWKVRPPHGWVARPPRAPGDRTPIVAGWYHPDGRAHGEILLVVHGDALAPEGTPLERGFPDWLTAWSRLVELEGTGTIAWEGRSGLRAGESRRGRLAPKGNGTPVKLLARFLESPGFNVGIVVMAPETRWNTLFDLVPRTLACVDRSLVRRHRGETERKEGQARSTGSAHAERVLAGLPRDWGSRRTRRYVFVHDGRVPRDLVGRLAVILESARTSLYERRFGVPPGDADVGVVKITSSREQFLSYGAPPESAAYWAPGLRELVLAWTEGEEEALVGSMLHEGFHQFMHVWTAGLMPHRWFDEGWAEIQESVEVRGTTVGRPGKSRMEPYVDGLARANALVPLATLVRMDLKAFYGDGGETMVRHYAQSWSLVDFLESPAGSRWKRFSETYVRALREEAVAWRAEIASAGMTAPEVVPGAVAGRLRNRALDQALKRFDLAAIEKAWRESLR